jgi:type 1 fimbria pilin
MKKPLIGILTFAYGLSLPAFSADTATLTLSGRVVTPTCSVAIVNEHPQQHCGKNTDFIDTQNMAVHSRGVVTQTVNLTNDVSRKIIISSYD